MHRRYSEHEDQRIRDGLAAGQSYGHIGRELGRKPNSIRWRALRNGWTVDQRFQSGDADEQAVLLRLRRCADEYCHAAQAFDAAGDEAVDQAARFFGQADEALQRAGGSLVNDRHDDPLADAAIQYARAALRHQRTDQPARPSALAHAHEILMTVWRRDKSRHRLRALTPAIDRSTMTA